MSKTLEEIRRDGLAALRERLGVAGMVRFLQQFEHGSGDYVVDRREWAELATLDDLRKLLTKPSTHKRRRAG